MSKIKKFEMFVNFGPLLLGCCGSIKKCPVHCRALSADNAFLLFWIVFISKIENCEVFSTLVHCCLDAVILLKISPNTFCRALFADNSPAILDSLSRKQKISEFFFNFGPSQLGCCESCQKVTLTFFCKVLYWDNSPILSESLSQKF